MLCVTITTVYFSFEFSDSCHRLFTFQCEGGAMEHRGQVLGPASTRFNDYIGTVAADDVEAIKDRPSLYELALIDRDRFTIVGIDLNVDGPANATVYAVDRTEHEVGAPADIAGLGETQGEIPVLPFDVPEPNVEEFIRHAFRRISIRLLRQDLGDQVLAVSEPRTAKDL
jgi:hypothetical protein